MVDYYPRPISQIKLEPIKPRQASMTSRTMTSGRLKKWLDDRSNQAGAREAGQIMLEGASTDPWGSLTRGIGAFFGARAQDRRLAEEEGRRDEMLAYERGRQGKEDARKEEEFELRKKAAEAALADEAEERARAEEERLAIREHFGTLTKEEQDFFRPYIGSADVYFKARKERDDDRQAKERFDAELELKKAGAAADEKYRGAQIGLERERNQIAREGQQLRATRNQVVTRNGTVSVISPSGEVLSSTRLPADPDAARREVAKIMVGTGLTAEEAYAQVQRIGELTGAGPQDTGVTDDATAREIAAFRAEGLSDEDILAMASPAERERVRRLLGGYALPRR